MINSYHTLKQLNSTTIGAPDASATLRSLPATCRGQAIATASTCKRYMVDTVSTLGTSAQKLSDYSIKHMVDALCTIGAATRKLNDNCNPVNIMMRSECAYIREPTRRLKQEVDGALLYFLKKPKRFVKLMVALGFPIPPETLITLTLENFADKLNNLTPEEIDKRLAFNVGKKIKRKEKKEKAKLLVSLLKAPSKDMTRLYQSLDKSCTQLFGLAMLKALNSAPDDVELDNYIRSKCNHYIPAPPQNADEGGVDQNNNLLPKEKE